jgi:6-pyruvoyltetrahydropterin/6-carboxytetrahydropterin synthase
MLDLVGAWRVKRKYDGVNALCCSVEVAGLNLNPEIDMAGIFEMFIETHFAAAHRLEGYPGDCARSHGHNWIVEVYVQCKSLNTIGIGVDFRDIKVALDEVLCNLDHFDLNELEPFKSVNPSAENIARYLYGELSKKINANAIRVSKVKVSETPGTGAFYWEE